MLLRVTYRLFHAPSSTTPIGDLVLGGTINALSKNSLELEELLLLLSECSSLGQLPILYLEHLITCCFFM